MCGIFAAVKFNGFFDRRAFDRFVELTDLVSYRGPDDSGYLGLNLREGRSFEKPGPDESFDVFLGHRRLSIIDLSSAGRQPMTDGEGRWIIYNGEIFNFVELREELKSRGCEFSTGTDTEVILQLYKVFGESGFDKMNGMWSLAIADISARRIILSRDRFSMKPLYLLSNDSGFYIASEIKQLLPLLNNKRMNLTTLSAFLAQGLLDHSSETFFKDISKVPPKCNIVISLPNGKIEQKAYWEYEKHIHASLASAQEEFRHLLLDSTRIRLRSDVKVGLLLSGGLDSSSLALAATSSGQRDLETYSVVSSHDRFNEEPFIDEVNRSLKLKSNKFRFELLNLRETLLQTLYHGDEPFVSLSMVAQYGMLETIKKSTDVRVLLSGQGGDEILLGYLKFFFFYIGELFRGGHYLRAINQLMLSTIRGTVVRQFRLSEAKRYMPRMSAKNRSALRGEYTPIPVWNGNGIRSRQIADIDAYSVPALAHYEDRNSMAHSLEVRHPFLDHRLVEFAISLPPEWQLAGGWTKSVLRQSFPELPHAIRWRRDKQGFITPEEFWLKGELTDFIEHTFDKSLLDEMGIFDHKIFLEQYRSFCKGSPLVSYGDISRAFIAELWAQQHWR